MGRMLLANKRLLERNLKEKIRMEANQRIEVVLKSSQKTKKVLTDIPLNSLLYMAFKYYISK